MKKRVNIWRTGVVIAAISLAWTIHAICSQDWFPLPASFSEVEPKANLDSQFIFITNSSNLLLPPESCKTYCPRGFFQNRIVYQYYHQAGLLDRLSIITKLANVAASLCAHVLMPTPNQLLSEPHNNDTATDPNFVWKDFLQLTFMQDPSIELLTESSEPAGSEHFTKEFTTDSVDQIEAHWQMARNHTYLNSPGSLSPNLTGFQWIFTFSLYEFVEPLNAAMNAELWNNQQRQHLQPTRTSLKNKLNPCPMLKDTVAPRCAYVKQTLTDELRQMAKDILKPSLEQVRKWQASNFSNPKVLYYMEQLQNVQQAVNDHWTIGLHVRRGDSASRCDTSLEKMVKYLRCSIADHLPQQSSASDSAGETTEKNNATIFFFSDERDEGYRSSLSHSARMDLKLGFVDMDTFVSGALSSMDSNTMPDWKRSNNYYFFRVLQAVVEALRLDLSLEQRREISCETCTEAFASKLQLASKDKLKDTTTR